MRRVTRFMTAPNLSKKRRDVVIRLFVAFECEARYQRGRDPWKAREAAQRFREMIDAFCVPCRPLDLSTGYNEVRREVRHAS